MKLILIVKNLKKDFNNIKIDEGKRISILCEFIARNFIVYYYEKKKK